GVGKVVALEPAAVHVFFETCATKYATKLRLPVAMGMLAEPTTSTNARLDGMTFVFDEKAQRYGVSAPAPARRAAAAKGAARKRRKPAVTGDVAVEAEV